MKNIVIRIIPAVIALFLSVSLWGQTEMTVTGKVLNSSEKPLSDVAVNYFGSTQSPVITDTSGAFSIKVPSGDIWLSISPVSTYKEKRIYLNSRTNLNIYLLKEGEASVYDQIVYNGAEISKKDLVANVYTDDYKDAFNRNAESFDQLLQGKVAGLHQVGSGMPGSGTFMLLRGLNSINTSNQPLIIVDGMPIESPGVMTSVVLGYAYNPATSIDPNDISNLSIIKDGSALTSYGLKGSNGVILIETLKPVETNTSIDFKFKVGFTETGKQIPQLESDLYKTFAKEILASSPFLEEYYADYFPGLYLQEGDENYIRYTHNTNWQDKVFKNALMQDAYLSVKGGDAVARYGLSVGYLNHEGIFGNTNYNRFSTRFVGTFNVFSGLRMFVSANLVSGNAEYKESALSEQTSPILTALHKTPLMNPFQYDQDDNPLILTDDIDEIGVSNPRSVINDYNAKNSNYRFLTSFRVEGDLSKYLKFNSVLGLNINDLKEKIFMPNMGMELYYDDEAYNVSKALDNLLFMVSNDNYFIYNRVIDNVHAINARAGIRWQSSEFQEDIGIGMNSNENDEYTDIGSGDNQLRIITGNSAKWTWLTNYYTANYSYKDKYLLDAGISADFSSRVGKEAAGVISLGENAPFGIFYNIGAAWRLSGEEFLSDMPFIEDLKFRVNYGTSGNDDIGNTNAFNYYRVKLFRETSGMVPGGFANENLKYETNSQFTLGLDLSVMDNRLRFALDYFNARTSNMLVYEQLNSYMGYDFFASNGGALKKSGVELAVSTRLIQKSDLTLDLGLVASQYKSVVSEMPGGEIITDLPGGAQIINRVGEDANSFYGYEFNGVFASSLEAEAANLKNEKGIPFRAGDARFTDFSGPDGEPDNVINEYDKIVLGSATPDLYGGLTIDVNYKRFAVSMLWQFTVGSDNYNYLRYMNERMVDLSNQSSATINRWIYEGQDTKMPRATWGDPVGNSDFSSRWVESGSYARLKNLSVSYTIPENFLFFRDISFFLTGSNLLTISDYLSYDPEFSYSFDPMMQGIDYGIMPLSRTYMIGVKFGL